MRQLIRKLFKPSTDFAALVKDGAIVIDVRTRAEYAQGNLKGSRNIPLDMIDNEVNSIKKLNKAVITVCRSGARSSMATSILTKGGIEAYNAGPWTSLRDKINS
jgi:phage shock protein E